MCVSPITIPNPNYGNKTSLIQQTTDTLSKYLRVPCGVCNECLMKRQSDLVQRSRCLALDHYIFFCTLTYNRESLPHYMCSDGYSIPYADISDVQNMFKRIRNSSAISRPFKYFFVSERGSKGRPHFHGLLFVRKFPDDDTLQPAILEQNLRKLFFSEWRRNYGSHRSPIWKPLFTYRSKFVGGKRFANFDFHYVVPHSSEHGSDDVAFYVTKYVLKPSNYERSLQRALRLNLAPSEYSDVWKIVKSRCFCSKYFGACSDIETDYIKDCISRSSDNPNGFQFFNSDGSCSRLSRYYRKYVDGPSAVRSVSARGGPLSEFSRLQDELDSSLLNSFRIVEQVSSRDISDIIP